MFVFDLGSVLGVLSDRVQLKDKVKLKKSSSQSMVFLIIDLSFEPCEIRMNKAHGTTKSIIILGLNADFTFRSIIKALT